MEDTRVHTAVGLPKTLQNRTWTSQRKAHF